MKSSTKFSIAAAALSGLLMGTAARAATVSVPTSSGKQTVQKQVDAGQKAIKLDDTKKDIHDCAGKNDCKGKNTCKGKGGCAVKEEKK